MAGIALTVQQTAAILYYGGKPNSVIRGYLDDLAAFGTTVTDDDRKFVENLTAQDRTDEGLGHLLSDLLITKPQGTALLEIAVSEKEKRLDRIIEERAKKLRKKDKGPEAERLEQLTQLTDRRAVLVDMLYETASLLGPRLLHALGMGDAAAAAVEIAFFSNKDPVDNSGDDPRDRTRAEKFLGGALEPRTEEEARAFLRALAERSGDLAEALAKRRFANEGVEGDYRAAVGKLANVALRRLGVAATIALSDRGRLAVQQAVPLDRFAEAFGLTALEVALVNPELFPTAPDQWAPTMLSVGAAPHLPTAAERAALERTLRDAGPLLAPERYEELRRRYLDNLHPPPRGQAELPGGGPSLAVVPRAAPGARARARGGAAAAAAVVRGLCARRRADLERAGPGAPPARRPGRLASL